ncbi:MAG: carotenoid oxygenase [Pseudomonadales bacterium]|nr:carotenoid oxygenase [Pseudomonadales bacterium]
MSVPDLNSGALAPVLDEIEMTALKVTGEIPEALNGALLRNGPNPYSGRSEGSDVLSWWPEAAMLHSVQFADGEAQAYRNRWVRSHAWARYQNIEDISEFVETNPNVNILRHGGTTYAMAEGGVPLAVNSDLGTEGARALGAMTAHPKVDPVTGELFWFRADWNQPWLLYGEVDAQGQSQRELEIEVAGPGMMHDMAITASHSILMDLSVGYDFSLLQKGVRMPICWQEGRPSRLCLVPRGSGEVIWVEIEPCFIQHVINAYDIAGSKIVFDVVRYPWYLKFDMATTEFKANPLGVPWRYVIDIEAGTATETQLDDRRVELPRINESRTGRPYEYHYSVAQPSNTEMRGVLKYDLKTGHAECHDIDPGDSNSEPVFVPATSRADSAEDAGWVLVCVYRAATDTSEVRILDAHRIADAPLAVVDLGRRIPAGFHGAWIPA